jgi:glycosyltransferase involved in cell wall biosynthesis
MRLLLIARYLQKVNHRKVAVLAAQLDIDLWHVAPRRWTDQFQTYRQELKAGDGYSLLAVRTLQQGDIHRFIYWPPTLFINRIEPDVIHIEEEPDSLAALEVVLARQLLAPSARLVLFTWQNILRERRALVEQIARFVLHRVDHVIAGNREAIGVLRQQKYTGPVTVIPQLGVDTRIFRPQESEGLRDELGLSGFVIGYVGRLAPQKGLDDLVRAVAQTPDAHLLLLGRGPMRDEIESLARSLGIDNSCTIADVVPHSEVSRYMNAMDVLVLPSRTTPQWKEQFGHVLIEAMACGTPVIGSNSGAIPDVIDAAGLLFPEGDVDALAAHLCRLANNPKELHLMSQRGRERVADMYTHERIAEQTMEVYRSVTQFSKTFAPK